MKKAIAALFVFLAACPVCAAQSAKAASAAAADSRAALESIEELARRGKYYEAIVRLFEEEDLSTPAEKLAAAKAAWALGLVDTARELWDEVFAQRNFRDLERSRAMLARSILELQESKYEAARSFAEAAAQELSASDLRAQFWLVIAEGLKEQGALSLAEGYYKKAAEEGNKKIANEALFLLGECEFKLGLISEARYAFAGIDTSTAYTAAALKRLAEIDLSQRNYEGVVTWVEEGRDSYPSEFEDGWTTYALSTSLLELGRTDEAQSEVNTFGVKHTEQDAWFLLARAALEAKQAKDLYPEAAEKNERKLAAAADKAENQ